LLYEIGNCQVCDHSTIRFKSFCNECGLVQTLEYNLTSSAKSFTHVSYRYLLSVPRHNLSFGARAFRVAAPKIWNSIPLHIRHSQTYSSFRRHLKTHYFISAHLASWRPLQCDLILFRDFGAIYKSLTYLLLKHDTCAKTAHVSYMSGFCASIVLEKVDVS